MKKRKFLVLLPVVALTSCIGANWECTKEHALYVAERILAAQKHTSFSIPKNYFYSSEFFSLSTNYSLSGEALSTFSDKYQDTALMFLDEYKLKCVSKFRSFTEKETGETKTTSVTWVYVKKNEEGKNFIYFVYNTGAADGKKYVQKDISDVALTPDLFISYSSRVFNQSCLDIKGENLLDIKQVTDDVEYENSLDNIASEIHYFSKRDGTLSYQIDKTYDGYFEQIKETGNDGETVIIKDEYELYGSYREIYGWQDNLLVNHECYKKIDQIRNGIKTSVTMRDQSLLTANPVVKTLDKDSSDYIADYDFEEPNLASYVDVSELYPDL